jgi:serine protease AprX
LPGQRKDMVSQSIFIGLKKFRLSSLLFFLALLILARFTVAEERPAEKVLWEYPVESPKIGLKTKNLLDRLPSDSAIAVWIFFTDKGIKTNGEYRKAIEECGYQLSERSIERRRLRGKKPIFDFTDIPMKKEYLDELKNLNLKIRVVSKWLNGASVLANKNQIEEIGKLPFVRAIEKVATFYRKEPIPIEKNLKKFYEAPKDQLKIPPKAGVLGYGQSYAQLAQIHVPELHNLGYSGKGVLITMLDTGYFIHHRAFEHILNEGRLVATWDFIEDDEDVEDTPDVQREHGTYTFSALGGFVEDTLIGPAYGAQFALAKTEVVASETQIEEDHWVAGIEWAEDLGTDVVSSSLGYNDWYTYEDMDGNTAKCTIAADLAVSKGVVVVNAAGNERNCWLPPCWDYIIAPADGDSVIAVGAVDINGIIASFSSKGPTYDGRIKPDVVACGVNTFCASPYPYPDGSYARVGGTSLSTPLVAGVCALLLEIHPEWKPADVIQALHKTASQSDHPDSLMGYGIVDASKASAYLVLSAGRLEFETTWGDTHSQADTLIISSAVTESLEWKLIQKPDWVRMEPDSGLTPCTCTVWIDPSHLSVGIHQDTMKVSAKDAISSPQSVVVTLIIHYTAKIVAYPNPFSDSLTVLVDKSDANDKINVSVFTVAGELVYQFPKQDEEKVFERTWDGRNDKGRNVSSGIYLLKVDINGHSEIVKIAKTK